MIEQLAFTIVKLHQQPFQAESYILDVVSAYEANDVSELLQRLKFRRQAAVFIQNNNRMPGTITSVNDAGQLTVILHHKSARLSLGEITLEVQSLPPYMPPHEDDPGELDALHTQACLEEHLEAALAILKDRTPNVLELCLIDTISLYLTP